MARSRSASSDRPTAFPLSIIRNEKPVSPAHPDGARCLQLETAMGAAIECFEGAEAVCVPRDRLALVKTTADLLRIWSDAYELREDLRMVAADPEVARLQEIELDPRFFGNVDDLRLRFPQGAPSLTGCRRFAVSGDHRFGPDISVVGQVALNNESEHPVEIEAGSILGDAD